MSAENKNKIMPEETTFPFIQEKILPKKNRKVKKIILSVASTTILAILFGVVGRLVFNASDPLACKLLGQKNNEKAIIFPTASSDASKSTNTDDGLQQGKTTKENNTTEFQSKTVIIQNNAKLDINDFEDMYAKISDIVKESNKSIVTVSKVVSGVDSFKDSYETTNTTTNSTSGIVIANDQKKLLILTYRDKIVNAKKIKVTFMNDVTVSAKIIDSDSDTGLAVVAVSLDDIPYKVLANIKVTALGESYTLQLGDPIIAIGSPNGFVYSMGLGIITNINNSVYVTDNKLDLMNTDIEYNPNSAGFIINLKGEIVGIITQKYKKNINEQINTVIAISRAKPIIESLASKTERVYFGIMAADLTTESAKDLDVSAGIYVTKVEANSPAFDAGIQTGDVIIKINDKVIENVSDFNKIISKYDPKESIHVKVKRASSKEPEILKLILKGKSGK